MFEFTESLAIIDLFLAAVYLVLLIILAKRKVDAKEKIAPRPEGIAERILRRSDQALADEFDRMILGEVKKIKKKPKP